MQCSSSTSHANEPGQAPPAITAEKAKYGLHILAAYAAHVQRHTMLAEHPTRRIEINRNHVRATGLVAQSWLSRRLILARSVGFTSREALKN